jgi:hypothetical protein
VRHKLSIGKIKFSGECTRPVDLSSIGGRVFLVRLYLAPAFGKPVNRVCFAQAVAAYLPEGSAVPHETTVKGWEEGARPDDATVTAIADLALAVGFPWATKEWITYRTGQDPPILPPVAREGNTYTAKRSEDARDRKGKAS